VTPDHEPYSRWARRTSPTTSAPSTIRRRCPRCGEDDRAGLGIDRAHDEADREAGRRIACPLLVLRAVHDDMEDLYGDPVAVRGPRADDVRRGVPLDCGHHMAEEAPEALVAQPRDVLDG
jgi:haloacetate dehalogenase